jgi:hypothetical protein
MPRISPVALAPLLGLILSSSAMADEPEAKPSIRIRLSHPDKQLQEVLDLFKEAKAKNPAAALAAWKRASKEPNRLGKPLEALIAALNPKMVEELKTLDRAEVSIHFNPQTGDPEWFAILPNDDGTFAALASAFVLSGGAAEAPIGEVPIDRLAGPGSPLMARVEGGTLIASNRDGIKRARARLSGPIDPFEGLITPNGVQLVIEPGSLKGSKSLNVQRLEELLRTSDRIPKEIRDATSLFRGYFELGGGIFMANLVDMAPRKIPKVSINPSWYDWIPKTRVITCFAFATDSEQKSWDSLFALADRIEKLDPARATIASSQVRLDLLARLSGLRLENDLLTHLKGVSGWVGSSNSKDVNQALLAFHLDDPEAAERIVNGFKPIPGSGQKPGNEPERSKWLGQVEGQSLWITRSERAVVLSWGVGVLEASLKARDNPDHSSGAEIRKMIMNDEKALAGGVVWPERIPRLGLAELPRDKDEEEILPVFWFVYPVNNIALTLGLVWGEIDQTVKRFLDLIPLDPPPDH